MSGLWTNLSVLWTHVSGSPIWRRTAHVFMSNKFSSVMETSSTTINIMKNKEIEPDFEPSMKTLIRIMELIANNASEGKTCLARDANLNYARLAKHIVWLEKKGLVESVVDDQKINVVLTQKGRTFGTMLIN